MLGAPGEQIERVREHRQNSRQRGSRPRRAARQIDDQGRPQSATDGAAQRGKRCMQQPFSAHPLSQAIDKTIADLPRCFGSDVALGDTRPSGRDDEIRCLGVPPQGRRDQIDLIRQNRAGPKLSTRGLQQLADRWT